MYSKFYSPNILATASSDIGENSYSHVNDPALGVSVIDKFTHYMLQFMEQVNKTSKSTMADLFATYNFEAFNSNAGVRSDLFKRRLDQTLVTDFFGGVTHVEVDESIDQKEVQYVFNDKQKLPETQATKKLESVNDSSLSFLILDTQPSHQSMPWQAARTYLASALILTLVLFGSLRY